MANHKEKHGGMGRRARSGVAGFALALMACLGGCDLPLNGQEARAAFEELAASSQAESLTSGPIQITTHFTIGDGVRQAAEQLQALLEANLPCADIQLEVDALVITYGAGASSDCGSWAEAAGVRHIRAGSHRIEVTRNDSQVVVEHDWDGLTDGRLTINGSAEVTWDAEARSRHVVHHLEWSHRDGRSGSGQGDRTQRALNGEIRQGLRINGHRQWESDRGAWWLDINDVSLRWADPVPFDGSYLLETPFDKSASVHFFQDREGDPIQVRLQSGRRSFDFEVQSANVVEN